MIGTGDKQSGLGICGQKGAECLGIEMVSVSVAAGDDIDARQAFRGDYSFGQAGMRFVGLSVFAR